MGHAPAGVPCCDHRAVPRRRTHVLYAPRLAKSKPRWGSERETERRQRKNKRMVRVARVARALAPERSYPRRRGPQCRKLPRGRFIKAAAALPPGLSQSSDHPAPSTKHLHRPQLHRPIVVRPSRRGRARVPNKSEDRREPSPFAQFPRPLLARRISTDTGHGRDGSAPRPRAGGRPAAVGGHGDGLPGARVPAARPRGPRRGGPARVPRLAPRRRRPVPVARARPAPGPRRALHALGAARHRLRVPLRRAPVRAGRLPQALRRARAGIRRRPRAPAAPRVAGRRPRTHFPPVPEAAEAGAPAAPRRRRGAPAGPDPAVASPGAPGARRQAVHLLPRSRRAARPALPQLRQPQDLGRRQARGRRGAGALAAPTPLALPRPVLPAQAGAARHPRRLPGPPGAQRAGLRRVRRGRRGGGQARCPDRAVRCRGVQDDRRARGRAGRHRRRPLRLLLRRRHVICPLICLTNGQLGFGLIFCLTLLTS